MNERQFQGYILDVAARFGWRAWHVPAPMRPVGGGLMVPETRAAGLPDLILMHPDPPRLIFAEVKDADGKLSEAQAEFLRLARGVAEASAVSELAAEQWSGGRIIGVYVWRPGNEDLIEAVLRGKVMIS